MSDLHFVRASRESAESVCVEFAQEGLLQARAKTWKALGTIREQISEGMTEHQASALAIRVLADLGASKNWHKPYVRFGAGTALSFHDRLRTTDPLALHQPVYIDLGPVWIDETTGVSYEGDVGDTYVFGEHPEAEMCAVAARVIFSEAQALWKTGTCTGRSLYDFVRQRALEEGYTLLERVDGHRLGDYPHTKHSKERLANLTFHPSTCLWVLEIQLLDRQNRFGAFYEDLLLDGASA